MSRRALGSDAVRLGLTAVSLSWLFACGIARGPSVDSESHFIGCSQDVDCAGLAGGTCSNGHCVDVVGDEANASVADPSELSPEPPSAPTKSGAACSALNLPFPITDQATLDQLEGCEEIDGDISLAFEADLRPLHALRRLHGGLWIGGAGSPGHSPLEGLENLEVVQRDLMIGGPSLTSLASLRSLRSVGDGGPGAAGTYGLTISGSALRDLTGLEGLAVLGYLSISQASELVSLEGLQLPRQMSNVWLNDLPQLRSTGALSSVSEFERLYVSNTGLSRLDLSAAQRIGLLSLTENPALADVTVPASEMQRLEIRSNPVLRSVAGVEQLASADTMNISENPALGALGFAGLQSVRLFEVLRNPALQALEAPLLREQVAKLVVVSNTSLPPESLTPMAGHAKRAKLAGNQGESVGLDPCPFVGDGYCDEPPTDGLCAPDTDRLDCRN